MRPVCHRGGNQVPSSTVQEPLSQAKFRLFFQAFPESIRLFETQMFPAEKITRLLDICRDRHRFLPLSLSSEFFVDHTLQHRLSTHAIRAPRDRNVAQLKARPSGGQSLPAKESREPLRHHHEIGEAAVAVG